MDHGSNITTHRADYVPLRDVPLDGARGEEDIWREWHDATIPYPYVQVPAGWGVSHPIELVTDDDRLRWDLEQLAANLAALNGAPALIVAETARTQGRAA